MKILLVHPEDSIEAHARSGIQWNCVVDLGWSGRHIYTRLTDELGFRVFSVNDLVDHESHRLRMRDLLALGLGEVVGGDSLDWWDIYSAYPYQQLEQIVLMSALNEQFPEQSEIVATRSNFATRALAFLRHREIRTLAKSRPPGIREKSNRYLKAALNLRPAQLAEISFDKWDTGYNLRRRFARSPQVSSTPAVLLPSAYANVSRAHVAYARMLPNRRFLSVVTRRNGRLHKLPDNVEVRSLASYALSRSSSLDGEYDRLMARWQESQAALSEKSTILRTANALNVFDGFAKFLKGGLQVRDAWREVLVREPIAAVLSADENNCYTRMPIAIANSKQIRTVFCDHGALNMSFGIRNTCSDSYLMRDEMAHDYAVNFCRLSPEKLVVGGPEVEGDQTHSRKSKKTISERDWIVFYSEAYELSNGRAHSLYAELLPELYGLALQTNRRIIVKLHPFESRRARRAIARQVLSAEHQRLLEFREGPMTGDLFERAWFSVTVESSVAVESTINGVPCFLCSWFDSSWYEYGKQYAKFSAGYQLDSPHQIREIPELLEQFQITEATRRGLQTTISREQLDSILFRS